MRITWHFSTSDDYYLVEDEDSGFEIYITEYDATYQELAKLHSRLYSLQVIERNKKREKEELEGLAQ